MSTLSHFVSSRLVSSRLVNLKYLSCSAARTHKLHLPTILCNPFPLLELRLASIYHHHQYPNLFIIKILRQKTQFCNLKTSTTTTSLFGHLLVLLLQPFVVPWAHGNRCRHLGVKVYCFVDALSFAAVVTNH